MEERAELPHFQGLSPEGFAGALVEQVGGDNQHQAFQKIIDFANSYQFEDPREKPTSEFYQNNLARVALTVSNKLENDIARAACASLTSLIIVVARSNPYYQTMRAIENVLVALAPYKADNSEGNRVGAGPLRDFRNLAFILHDLDPDLIFAGYREVELSREPAEALLQKESSPHAEVVRIIRGLEREKVKVPRKGEDRNMFEQAMEGARQKVVDLCTQHKLGPFETRLTCIMLDNFAKA